MSARLFVALDLPAEVREELAAFGRAAAGSDPVMRPLPASSMHLTLAFIGHRPLDDIEPAAEAVRASAPVEAPALALAGALWLAPRRPHVLTVAFEDRSGALAAMQAGVVEGLVEAIGFEPERRAFRPHVTVARVRRGAMPRTDGLRPAPQAAFAGEALTLYRSYLGGRPVRYEVVERVMLGAATTE